MSISLNMDFRARLVLFAIIVGAAAGGGAVLLKKLIALVHNLVFIGHFSFSYSVTVPTELSYLGPWIILAPALGALPVAFLVKKLAPESGGRGVQQVINVIHFQGGIMRPVVAVARLLTTAISLGTGAAIGREGPIIQIGAVLGSNFARWCKSRDWERTTLVACGIGGGVAAIFNAPFGGLLFTAEMILPETSPRTMIPLTLAVSAATILARLILGNHPTFHIPAIPAGEQSLIELVLGYVGLGVLLGLSAWAFTWSINVLEELFSRFLSNVYVRHALGMLGVGVMMYVFANEFHHYYIEGIGYAPIEDILKGTLNAPYLLLLLFAAKLLATSLALGSGASGGIFSPALFLGATLATAYGMGVNAVMPGFALNLVTLAVVGMAALAGSATGAIIATIAIIIEMTRDYAAIVPLLITASVAYAVRRVLLRDSIYTLGLRRRGHMVFPPMENNTFLLRHAGEIAYRRVEQVASGTRLAELADRYRKVPLFPHVLVVEGGSVKAVLSADQYSALSRFERRNQRVDAHADTQFITVSAEKMMFDVLAELCERNYEIALITKQGTLDAPEDVTGVLVLRNLVYSNNLPIDVLRQRRRNAADSA